MHDLVPRRSWGHQVTLLDPAETPGQTGRLRLINPSTTEAGITIRGVDGTGAMPGGEVRLTLAAGASRVVTAADLEGGTGSGLSGSLGDGTGAWHLGVTANRRDAGDEPAVGSERASCQPVDGAERHSWRVGGCVGRVFGHGDGGGGVRGAHLGAGGSIALHRLPCGGRGFGEYADWCSYPPPPRTTKC